MLEKKIYDSSKTDDNEEKYYLTILELYRLKLQLAGYDPAAFIEKIQSMDRKVIVENFNNYFDAQIYAFNEQYMKDTVSAVLLAYSAVYNPDSNGVPKDVNKKVSLLDLFNPAKLIYNGKVTTRYSGITWYQATAPDLYHTSDQIDNHPYFNMLIDKSYEYFNTKYPQAIANIDKLYAKNGISSSNDIPASILNNIQKLISSRTTVFLMKICSGKHIILLK